MGRVSPRGVGGYIAGNHLLSLGILPQKCEGCLELLSGGGWVIGYDNLEYGQTKNQSKKTLLNNEVKVVEEEGSSLGPGRSSSSLFF